jgi:hypothetical protein
LIVVAEVETEVKVEEEVTAEAGAEVKVEAEVKAELDAEVKVEAEVGVGESQCHRRLANIDDEGSESCNKPRIGNC